MVFHRIILKYPDLQILFEYARSNATPALSGGDGIVRRSMPMALETSEILGSGYIRLGKVTAIEYTVIHRLAMVIRTEQDYMTICDSLGVPPEYGPQARPKYRTWMLQTEATLLNFFAQHSDFLYKMAHLRMAFSVSGYLIFCDETLVSLGHKISVMNDYASVHDPPLHENTHSSADSKLGLGKKGKSFPSTSMDKQDDSAENDIETKITPQSQNIEFLDHF